MHSTSTRHSPSRAPFAATRWSLILAANAPQDAPAARRALDDLLRIYWFPLYAFLRRRGHAPHAAEDLTQGFLADLLARNDLAAASPAQGKFRSFLLAALTHYESNQRDHDRAQKRGGGYRFVSLDAESRYALEPADTLTPDRLFDRRWALALLARVLAQLESRYTARNEGSLYAALKPLLTTSAPPATYATLAVSLNTTENALKTAAHRLRRRYRDLLREEIARTLADPSDIDEEITYLLHCV